MFLPHEVLFHRNRISLPRTIGAGVMTALNGMSSSLA
jgi:hypothetical protein